MWESLLGKPELLLKSLAILGTFVAMITDMKWGKIYNWLTFPLMFTGWILNAFFFGWSGFGLSFAGTLLGIVFYLGFATVGAIGMGDVKLLGAVGALTGPAFVTGTFLYSSVLGVPHSLLIQYLNHGSNFLSMMVTSYTTGAFLEKTIDKDTQQQRYHFYMGIDIWIGSMLAWIIEIPIKL